MNVKLSKSRNSKFEREENKIVKLELSEEIIRRNFFAPVYKFPKRRAHTRDPSRRHAHTGGLQPLYARRTTALC